MNRSLGSGVRGALTLSAARGYLVGSAITLLLVAVGTAAMIDRGVRAAQNGDSLTATTIFVAGSATGILVLAFMGGLVIYLRGRARKSKLQFAALLAGYPDDLSFLVGYPLLAPASPSDVLGFSVSDVDALVVSGSIVSFVRIRPSVEVIGNIQSSQVSVVVGTRRLARTEVVQVELRVATAGGFATIGVLPASVLRFSNPQFESLDALADAIRERLKLR